MKRDITLDALQLEHIDHLLAEWHHWCKAEKTATGYPRTAAGCSQYRASRQYDLHNGALDQDADNALSQAVDATIAKMADPWRSALHIEARNLTSARVWESPRIPAEMVALVTRQAKQMLWGQMYAMELV